MAASERMAQRTPWKVRAARSTAPRNSPHAGAGASRLSVFARSTRRRINASRSAARFLSRLRSFRSAWIDVRSVAVLPRAARSDARRTVCSSFSCSQAVRSPVRFASRMFQRGMVGSGSGRPRAALLAGIGMIVDAVELAEIVKPGRNLHPDLLRLPQEIAFHSLAFWRENSPRSPTQGHLNVNMAIGAAVARHRHVNSRPARPCRIGKWRE